MPDRHLVPGSIRIVADPYLAAPAIAVRFAADGDQAIIDHRHPFDGLLSAAESFAKPVSEH